jgi:hypothetical protein
MRFDPRKGFSALAAIIALLPAVSGAQTMDRSVGETRALSLSTSVLQASGQETKEQRSTRGRNMAIGAAIGASVGVVLGEFCLGQGMDLPHGPDMLIGAGIGVGIGVGLGALFSGNGRTESPGSASKASVTVLPIVTPSRKALLLTVPLR